MKFPFILSRFFVPLSCFVVEALSLFFVTRGKEFSMSNNFVGDHQTDLRLGTYLAWAAWLLRLETLFFPRKLYTDVEWDRSRKDMDDEFF